MVAVETVDEHTEHMGMEGTMEGIEKAKEVESNEAVAQEAAALLLVAKEPETIEELKEAYKLQLQQVATLTKLVMDMPKPAGSGNTSAAGQQVAAPKAPGRPTRPPSPPPKHVRSLSPRKKPYDVKAYHTEAQVDVDKLQGEHNASYLAEVLQGIVQSQDVTQTALQDLYGIAEKHEEDILNNVKSISNVQAELRESELYVYGTLCIFSDGKGEFMRKILNAIKLVRPPKHLHQYLCYDCLNVQWSVKENLKPDRDPETKKRVSERSVEQQQETPLLASFGYKEANKWLVTEEATKGFMRAKLAGLLPPTFSIVTRPSDALERCQMYVKKVVDLLNRIFLIPNYKNKDQFAPLKSYGCARQGGPDRISVYLFKCETDEKVASIIDYDELSTDSRTALVKPVTKSKQMLTKPLNVTGYVPPWKSTQIDPEIMGVRDVSYEESDDDVCEEDKHVFPLKPQAVAEEWNMHDLSLTVPALQDSQLHYKVPWPVESKYGMYPRDYAKLKQKESQSAQFRGGARGRSSRGGYDNHNWSNPTGGNSNYNRNFPPYQRGTYVNGPVGRAGFRNNYNYNNAPKPYHRFTERGRDSSGNVGWGGRGNYRDGPPPPPQIVQYIPPVNLARQQSQSQASSPLPIQSAAQVQAMQSSQDYRSINYNSNSASNFTFK